MLLALVVISGICGLSCLYLAIDCLFTASRENLLPDMERVDIGDTVL